MAPTMRRLALGATLGAVALIGTADAKSWGYKGKKHDKHDKHDDDRHDRHVKDYWGNGKKATTKGKDWLWSGNDDDYSYDYDYDYSYDYTPTPTPTPTPTYTPTLTPWKTTWRGDDDDDHKSRDDDDDSKVVETANGCQCEDECHDTTSGVGAWCYTATGHGACGTLWEENGRYWDECKPAYAKADHTHDDDDDDNHDDDDDSYADYDYDYSYDYSYDYDSDPWNLATADYSYDYGTQGGYWRTWFDGMGNPEETWVDTQASYSYETESFWATQPNYRSYNYDSYASYDTEEEASGMWSWFETIFGVSDHAEAEPTYWEQPSYETETDLSIDGLLGGLLEELFEMTEDMSFWAETPGMSYDWSYYQSPAVDSYDWWSENEWWFEEEEMTAEDEMSAWLDTMINEAEALSMEYTNGDWTHWESYNGMWGSYSYETTSAPIQYDPDYGFTDHGCNCLPNWQFYGVEYNGCANPDDSEFAWCYVDPAECHAATEGAHEAPFSHWDSCFSRPMVPPPAPWINWVAEDVAWNHDRHEGTHHEHGCDDRDRVPFGAFGASLPWLDFGTMVSYESYDAGMFEMSAPAVISVDIGGIHGMNHSNLTGAFSSCISRQATSVGNGFGGLFSSLIGGIFNSTDTEGLFDIGATHLADAMGSVDLECVLYGFVNGTGSQGHGFGGGKRGVGKGKTTNLPAVHAPKPCTAEQKMQNRPHCAKEGEVVEVLGSWGVAVPEEAANVAVTMETGTTQTVAVVDPVTGHKFTIDITVSATAAEDTELDTKIISSSAKGGVNLNEGTHSTTFGEDVESVEDAAQEDFEAMYWRLRTKHAEAETEHNDQLAEDLLVDNAIYIALGGVIAALLVGVGFWRRKAKANAGAAATVAGLVGVMPPDSKGAGQRVVIAMPATAMASAQNAEKAVVEALPALEC